MEIFFEEYMERLHDLHHDFVATFEGLPLEALDWVPGQDMNSLCVLVVHTTGSARYWIGDVALGETSNRNRDAEFQVRGLSHVALKARFTALEEYAHAAVERLTIADLPAARSIPGRDKQTTVVWALLHALEHTGIHLGHAQITRQLWEQQ
ncbi:MAG: DinB family protein [Anaerolineae bacterium]